MTTTRLFSVALILLFAGCADSIVSECDADAAIPVSARFSDIQERVFDVSCATPGCHSGSNPQAGLSLESGQAYAQLVGVESLNLPGSKRIEAGNSGASMMIGLMRGTLSPVMPPQGTLDPQVIDSIAVWIDNGARND